MKKGPARAMLDKPAEPLVWKDVRRPPSPPVCEGMSR